MSMLQHGLSEDSSYTSYTINQSLRFRASNSAYLSRTPASNGNLTTWTWSGWFKRGSLSSAQQLFVYNSGANYMELVLTSSDTILWDQVTTSTQANRTTAQVFRDPCAWYHLVCVWDTLNVTASSRMRMYLNGVQIVTFSASADPGSGLNSYINQAIQHRIGLSLAATQPFDGYLSEVNFIDGQALGPEYFGQIDAITGIWVPKKYTGTYGTNGFYLPFNDATSLTTLGYDRSGNGNNWTCNGISITAGATYDVMKDSPTNGPNEVGNYATLNPLDKYTPDGSMSDGNLKIYSPYNWICTRATIGVSSGKWYWETAHSGYSQSYQGIADASWPLNPNFPGYSSVGYSASYDQRGYKNVDGSWDLAYGASFTLGDVIGYALDMDNGTLTCYKNGVSQGVMVSGLTAYGTIFPVCAAANGTTINVNFGQRPFAYTPPTGFKTLHTGNLADATPVTTSGTFTGNASADGPCIFINGTPTAMTINSNAVTFATHADKLAGGFKLRTSSASYNSSGTNTYSITTNSGKFKNARAQANP